MFQTHFHPWIKQLFEGLALVVAGLYVAAASVKLRDPYLALAGICVAALGIVFVQRAMVREHGQKVERDAIRALTILGEKWGITVEPNVELHAGGDLDLLITKADKTKFAVEIKAYEGVLLKRSLLRTKESLVRLNGKPFDKDPCSQVLAAAQEVQATPIIWLPSAKKAKTYRMKSGVTVVQGGPRQLRQAIGIKGWLGF